MNAGFLHTPDPLREEPPADQFCDVVLNGGVASGVVYPWALLKLARHYRFKNIGGNSVGAMAAVMAAAAEYGRCQGVENAFEPLRRMPTELAEEEGGVPGGRTKMLRLFQPSASVRRLFDLFLAVVSPPADPVTGQPLPRSGSLPGLVLRLYGVWVPLVALLLLAGWAAWHAQGIGGAVLAVLGFIGAGVVALLVGVLRFIGDLHALGRNGYGLCTGRGQVADEQGLVEWLHEGVQRSAGRGREDPPLTFADLWAAPRAGRAGPAPLPGGLQPPDAGINLQMFTSNVTQGRPVRLPLHDANTRLYYHPGQWAAFFPRSLMTALQEASKPYAPASASDPDPATTHDADQARLMASLRELPSGGMPIVVAARLSLCFPLLFSCVPVYAVDHETPPGRRRLGRCLLSDGGLCTNFPIHLFDAAHPRWPTFAMLLDNRLSNRGHRPRWLPEEHTDGRTDNWQRSVPGAEDAGQNPSLLMRLLGLAGGMLLTMKDWNDRVTGRLPHVRNRIIRLGLQPGEGQLHLAMPRETILRMAHVYGTQAGEELVAAFAPDEQGAKPAWREHLYVRGLVELRALRRHLRGYARGVHAQCSTVPLGGLLDGATRQPPLRGTDASTAMLTAAQRLALGRAVQAVATLEAELSACEDQFGPYRPVLEPELRLRPPV